MGARTKVTASKADDDVFKVWDMNWDAVRAFIGLQTQWRTVSLSTSERSRVIRTGIDYGVVPITLKLLGIKRRRDVFARLQMIEGFAIEAMSELAT